MGQLLLPAALTVGSLALKALFGTRQNTPDSPKEVDSTETPKSEYGASIPLIIGRNRLTAPMLVWALPLKKVVETTETSSGGGKGGGGGSQTTEEISYTISCMWIIGEPIYPNGYVRRVWLDNKPVYNADADTDDAIEKSNEFAQYMTVYDGSPGQQPSAMIEEEEGTGEVPSWANQYSLLELQDMPTSIFGRNGYPTLSVEIIGSNGDDPTIEDALRIACLDAGLTLSQIAFNLNNPKNIKGVYFERNGNNMTEFIERLGKIYHFGMRTDGNTIEFFDQDQPILGDIPYTSLGIREASQTTPIEPFIETPADPKELATTIKIQYRNWNNDGQTDIADATVHTREKSNETLIRVNLYNDHATMLEAAYRYLRQLLLQSTRYEEIYLPPSWLGLQVGDVVNLPVRGYFQPIQITEIVIGGNLIMRCKGLPFGAITPRAAFTPADPDDLNYQPIPEPDPNQFMPDLTALFEPPPPQPIVFNPQTLRTTGQALAIPLDIPLFKSSDFENQNGLYFAISAPLDSGWSTGGLFSSSDSGATFRSIGSVLTTSTVGTVATPTPSARVEVIDTLTTITVIVESGRDIDTVTQEDFDNLNQGIIIVGEEIIQYRDVLVTGVNQFELSHLRRGLFNTQDKMTHGVDETLVVLRSTNSYLTRVTGNVAQAGIEYIFKAVHSGQPVNSVTEQSPPTTVLGVSRQPYPPTHFKLALDSTNNDLILSWVRQARVGHGFRDDGNPVPLDELQESYQLEIYQDNTFSQLLFTEQVNKVVVEDKPCEFIYSELQQIADFGSTQTELNVIIRQLSQVFGKGFPLQITQKVDKVLL